MILIRLLLHFKPPPPVDLKIRVTIIHICFVFIDGRQSKKVGSMRERKTQAADKLDWMWCVSEDPTAT